MLNKTWIIALAISAAEAIQEPDDKCCNIWRNDDFSGAPDNYYCWDEYGKYAEFYNVDFWPGYYTFYCGKNTFFWWDRPSQWVEVDTWDWMFTEADDYWTERK